MISQPFFSPPFILSVWAIRLCFQAWCQYFFFFTRRIWNSMMFDIEKKKYSRRRERPIKRRSISQRQKDCKQMTITPMPDPLSKGRITTNINRTVGQNQVVLRHRIFHFPMSSGVSERASEQMNAAERASEASSAEQANERAVRANEGASQWANGRASGRASGRAFTSQYLLFWTTVRHLINSKISQRFPKTC